MDTQAELMKAIEGMPVYTVEHVGTLTARHLAFCQRHDWGINATLNADGTISNLFESFSDGAQESHTFYDFESLRQWAGY